MEGLAAGIATLIENIGTANAFIWSLFNKFLTMIMSDPLIAFPVLFSVLAGALYMVLRIIRKFGVRGKR